MGKSEHSYFHSKNRSELRTLLKIAKRKEDLESAVRIQGYLDDYPRRYPQVIEDEAERKRERKEKTRDRKIWTKVHPYFIGLWVVLGLSFVVLLAMNFRIDGYVLGKKGVGNEPVTARQALMLFLMGIGTFTLALSEYLEGSGKGYSLQAFRNSCMMITGFMVVCISLWLLVRVI